jgi:hypothetical protein
MDNPKHSSNGTEGGVQGHQSDNGDLHEKRPHCDFCMMTGSIATRPEFVPTSSVSLSISDSVHVVAVYARILWHNF